MHTLSWHWVITHGSSHSVEWRRKINPYNVYGFCKYELYSEEETWNFLHLLRCVSRTVPTSHFNAQETVLYILYIATLLSSSCCLDQLVYILYSWYVICHSWCIFHNRVSLYFSWFTSHSWLISHSWCIFHNWCSPYLSAGLCLIAGVYLTVALY